MNSIMVWLRMTVMVGMVGLCSPEVTKQAKVFGAPKAKEVTEQDAPGKASDVSSLRGRPNTPLQFAFFQYVQYVIGGQTQREARMR